MKGRSGRERWVVLMLLVACTSTTTVGHRPIGASHVTPTPGAVDARVTVPDVVGLDFRTATQKLLAADLQFRGEEDSAPH
jgi:hypothetical protein